ncbi:sporulation protein YabP [Carboxydothermus pertinax]|uniref:Sporulation protein YabP n=1 Tax=Carboxydothermus pertinax TaxID=870242 RepID=A0A1L8CYJ4_9THEO|nr:sporulation protein YabP [Carboxydothermus pertinax]GAV24006.1 sporulation protein YabP [Carboxydothermus pertinax]
MDETVKHKVEIRDRKTIILTGIKQVLSFNDEEILVESVQGFIVLKGEGLFITELNLESGNLTVEGFLKEFSYPEEGPKAKERGKGVWERLFR